jgi:DNA-binding PadR family transcriptional regulator
MNKTSYLGEFEHVVLLAILRLGDEAYGRSIREELELRAGREVSRSAAYITLERLAKKGYLDTRMGEPSPERGGKAKRYYRLTPVGREALREAGRALMSLWAGYESLLEEGA